MPTNLMYIQMKGLVSKETMVSRSVGGEVKLENLPPNY